MKTEKEIIEQLHAKVKELNNIDIKDLEEIKKFDNIIGEIKALKWVLEMSECEEEI